jgi:sirohydrochlorin ferrochelatase
MGALVRSERNGSRGSDDRDPAAILLVDHGSRRAEANAQLEDIAIRVRKREPDRIVQIAHMELAPPSIADGIDACVAAGARAIVVHPFLLAPGRHGSHDIPQRVGEVAGRYPEIDIRVSEPLGAHEKLVDVVLQRVAEAECEGA